MNLQVLLLVILYIVAVANANTHPIQALSAAGVGQIPGGNQAQNIPNIGQGNNPGGAIQNPAGVPNNIPNPSAFHGHLRKIHNVGNNHGLPKNSHLPNILNPNNNGPIPAQGGKPLEGVSSYANPQGAGAAAGSLTKLI